MGRSNKKNVVFLFEQKHTKILELKKQREKREASSHSSRQDALKHMHFDPESSIWKFDVRLDQMTDMMNDPDTSYCISGDVS